MEVRWDSLSVSVHHDSFAWRHVHLVSPDSLRTSLNGQFPFSARPMLQGAWHMCIHCLKHTLHPQDTDAGLAPSRLLLRLREARAAAASAASGARRERAVTSAAEMRLASAEAAEQRSSAALMAAEQRGHALDEAARRLKARLGRTEVELVRPVTPYYRTPLHTTSKFTL